MYSIYELLDLVKILELFQHYLLFIVLENDTMMSLLLSQLSIPFIMIPNFYFLVLQFCLMKQVFCNKCRRKKQQNVIQKSQVFLTWNYYMKNYCIRITNFAIHFVKYSIMREFILSIYYLVNIYGLNN